MNNLQVQPVVISGPSGAGKTTVVQGVLEQSLLPLVLSISCTTRAPRPDEQDGVNYHFLTREEFEQRQDAEGSDEGCVHGR